MNPSFPHPIEILRFPPHHTPHYSPPVVYFVPLAQNVHRRVTGLLMNNELERYGKYSERTIHDNGQTTEIFNVQYT
jgi:hypothetical protein